MKVTDEMVDAATRAFYQSNPAGIRGDWPSNADRVRAALEAALSHAAGQEVPPLFFVNADGAHGEYRGPAAWQEGMAELDDILGRLMLQLISSGADFQWKIVNDYYQRLRAAQAKLTPAQPPASAVVGRDAVLGCLPAPIKNPDAWPPGYADGFNDCAQLAYESVAGAMAASSGRNGDAT